jgi:hypothetical protein
MSRGLLQISFQLFEFSMPEFVKEGHAGSGLCLCNSALVGVVMMVTAQFLLHGPFPP